MKKRLNVYEYKDSPITFDFGDGDKMVNATQMTKVFGKRLDNFMRLKSTKEFIKVLESDTSDVRDRKIVRTVKGGRRELQGTWVHYKVAIDLAAWLSPQFKSWMYDRVWELIETGSTSLKRGNKHLAKKYRSDLLSVVRYLDELGE